MTRLSNSSPYGSDLDAPNRSGIMRSVIFLVLVAVIALGVWWLVSNRGPAVDQAKWQAVFLNNGQVYFGHLGSSQGEYLVLQNVYYLRATQTLQPSTAPAPTFDLVKLGGEIHGPEDQINFLRPSVLFWENMKSDSQVVRAIINIQAQLPK